VVVTIHPDGLLVTRQEEKAGTKDVNGEMDLVRFKGTAWLSVENWDAVAML